MGRLIYLSHTLLDIAFSVSVVSQFMNDLKEEHMEMVNRILRYLKLTPGKDLFFKKGTSREVEVYNEADWVGSVSDQRSTSGFCFFCLGESCYLEAQKAVSCCSK